jgi:hypothetical protein
MAEDAWRQMVEAQVMLRPDIVRVQEYGEAHREEWVGVRFVNGPKVVIETAFTDHLEQHRAELLAMVKFPDRLVVTEAAHSDAERSTVYEEVLQRLERHHRGVLSTASKGWERIEISLQATGGAVAQDLWERYGDLLAIRVGTKPFPPDRAIGHEEPRTRPPIPPGGSERDGVSAQIVLAAPTVPSGETVQGRIVLYNRSRRHVTIYGGQTVGSLVAPGTDDVVGVFIGAVPAFGLIVSMAPGEHGELPLLVGTASVLPGPEPRLPAGPYDAVAVVHLTRHDLLVARSPLILT